MYFATSTLTFLFPRIPIAELLRKKSGKPRKKRHNYTRADVGVDYIFEPAAADGLSYLTSQGRNVKCGDCIILGDHANPHQYQVEAIDYYTNPSDMWIALLKPIKTEVEGR